MSRLTGRKEDGHAYVIGCPEFKVPQKVNILLQSIADKCADIEDIMEDTYDLDRLRELIAADKDGRCVVLPDKKHTNEDGENALKSAMNTCYYNNNPVTRYIADAVAEKLTREAAEAALAKEADRE